MGVEKSLITVLSQIVRIECASERIEKIDQFRENMDKSVVALARFMDFSFQNVGDP